MPVSKVINQQSFHDGKVVLYQLENRPKQLWLCRIKVPNGTGYIYRGTGTSDLYEARKVADELLDELRINVKLGKSITGPNLKRLVDEFEEHSKATGKQSSRDIAIIALLKRYAVPYFAQKKITEINQKEIARFFDWRRQNSVNKAPKETTIIHEMSQLGTFLNWCYQRGHIDRKIEFERPKHDRDGEKRTIYSLRHTYATFRLQEGVNHYVLARNMGTSVKMLENFYGHTSNRAMADELTKMKVKKPKVLPWE